MVLETTENEIIHIPLIELLLLLARAKKKSLKELIMSIHKEPFDVSLSYRRCSNPHRNTQ